jgi:hypothetical protein
MHEETVIIKYALFCVEKKNTTVEIVRTRTLNSVDTVRLPVLVVSSNPRLLEIDMYHFVSTYDFSPMRTPPPSTLLTHNNVFR